MLSLRWRWKDLKDYFREEEMESGEERALDLHSDSLGMALAPSFTLPLCASVSGVLKLSPWLY